MWLKNVTCVFIYVRSGTMGKPKAFLHQQEDSRCSWTLMRPSLGPGAPIEQSRVSGGSMIQMMMKCKEMLKLKNIRSFLFPMHLCCNYHLNYYRHNYCPHEDHNLCRRRLPCHTVPTNLVNRLQMPLQRVGRTVSS